MIPTDANSKLSAAMTPAEQPFHQKVRSAVKFLRDCYEGLTQAEAEVIAKKLDECADLLSEKQPVDSSARNARERALYRLRIAEHQAQRVGDPMQAQAHLDVADQVEAAIRALAASLPAQAEGGKVLDALLICRLRCGYIENHCGLREARLEAKEMRRVIDSVLAPLPDGNEENKR